MMKNKPTIATCFQLETHRPPFAPHLPCLHGAVPPPHEQPHHPPHTRMRLVFGEEAWSHLLAPWTDEDSKNAVFSIIQTIAPPEIQILADQCQYMMEHLESTGVKMIHKVQDTCNTSPAMDDIVETNPYGWSNPVLTCEIRRLYDAVYGEEGKEYIKRLETAPFEVAVISTLFAFIMANMEVK